ncbi:MAG: hypothetical protein ACFE0P_08020 [Oceanicaulis sp.]
MDLTQLLLFAVSSGVLALQAEPPSPNWESRSSTDAFTGAEQQFLENAGEIIAGEPGDTQLVFRRSGETAELYWVSSHAYICEPDFEVRFGDNEPERIRGNLSTDRDAIFFAQPWYVLARMVEEGQLLIRLSDHCGNQSVARFSGSPADFLPELSVLSDSTGWSIDQNGYLTKNAEGIQVKFRRLADGRPDFSITLERPDLRGQRIPRRNYSATLEVAGELFQAETLFTSEMQNNRVRSDGGILISTENIGFDNIRDALETSPILLIEFQERSYSINLEGFERAFSLG